MIEFATLFLSLTLGTQPVEVEPSPEVAAVELILDGRAVARLDGPPWRAEVDFGPPMPHRLEAVARDADGVETGRVQQLLNLPRARAEARLVLTREGGVFRSARLIWQTVERFELTGLRVTFDGQPLAVDDPERMLLPDYDPRAVHYLVAELSFEDGSAVEAAAAFGAPFGDRVVSELTAAALSVGEERSLEPSEVESWLRVASGPARVVAVESPRAEVVLLRDRASVSRLSRLNMMAPPGTRRGFSTRAAEGVLAPGDGLRLINPVPTRAPSGSLRLFPSVAMPARLAIARALGGWRFDLEGEGEEDLWAAVRVAGLQAAQGVRRVVVAVVDPDAHRNASRGLAETRVYLRTLHVPFQLWTPFAAKRLPAGWADAGLVDVHTAPRLHGAVRSLRPLLDSQRIVWLEGLHLPQEIELTTAAPDSVRLAGSN